ncbi:MAG: GMP synthase (glutamine-hydrolyzing), partial [Deltaproteobacteria bacterium]|nr:GMP synthase (glutamine-hydrolyzing) [Deltaproteobacteria bacterium]
MTNILEQKVLILDFGSQTTQLIARRVREAKVYCEIYPYNIPLEKVKARDPKGIILSGGPASVYDKEAPAVSPELFELGVPILGICYGMQLTTHLLKGTVEHSRHREYGPARLSID